MPATTRARATSATLRLTGFDPRPTAAFALTFLLPAYLALAGAGHDSVLRDEVGLAVWWIVLLGALVGVLPLARLDRRCWLALAALGAFVAWTGLGITWSESGERSVDELARLALYAGILVLAVATITAANRRPALAGLVAAVSLLSILALLSRLRPAWFPSTTGLTSLPGTGRPLSYPLDYGNGLAALLALGVPATLALADSARNLVWRALAAGSVPITATALFLTGSRGGALALAAGLVTYLALAPERLPKLATLISTSIGSAVLVASVTDRPAFAHGLAGSLAQRQASQVVVITLLVCGGVALGQVGVGLACRHGEPPRWLVFPRRRALTLLALVLVAGAALLVALTGVPEGEHLWQAFKAPPVVNIASVQASGVTSGNGRYQFWLAALDAAAAHPWRGIGPGTFEFWWAAHGSFYSDVRHAYSLYFETLAETGYVGLALLLLALALVLSRGLTRVIGADPQRRLVLAAGVGGGVAFCVSAAVDWVWQLPAVVAAFLVLAAIGLGPGGASRARVAATRAVSRGQRLILAGAALIALVVVAIPLVGASELRASQAQAASARLAKALGRAGVAADLEPYAASPVLQRALVLELQGRFALATVAAVAATRAEPSNWRDWLVLSRLEAERGAAGPAVAAYRRARMLNPRSPIFKQ